MVAVRTAALLLVSLGAWLASPPTVSAQDVAEVDPVVEAKRLFDEAIVQLGAGRADIGRDLLRRSLGLHSRKSTRYNLGVALRRTGETTEAVAIFDGLLLERSLTKKERARVEQELRAAKGELATLIVKISGAETATLEIDAREVGEARAGQAERYTLDPGEHVIIARSGGTTRQRVNLARGQTLTVDLHVLSLKAQNAEAKKRRRRKRAAWIAPATAVVAAVVIAAVVVSQPSGETALVPGDTPAVGTLSVSRRSTAGRK